MGQKIVVGCIVKKEDSILLVKHSYGPTKGKWDFPKGHVELDESIENAPLREVKEETAITAELGYIFGLRQMVRNIQDKGIENDLLILWLLNYVKGEPTPDGKEILETAFFSVDDIMNSSEISGWTKSVINAAIKKEGFIDNGYIPKSKLDGTIYWRTFTV